MSQLSTLACRRIHLLVSQTHLSVRYLIPSCRYRHYPPMLVCDTTQAQDYVYPCALNLPQAWGQYNLQAHHVQAGHIPLQIQRQISI